MINEATIQTIRKSKAGRDFLKHCLETIQELNDLSDIDTMSGNPNEIAVEVVARKRAVEKLKKIVMPIAEFQDFPEPPEQETY